VTSHDKTSATTLNNRTHQKCQHKEGTQATELEYTEHADDKHLKDYFLRIRFPELKSGRYAPIYPKMQSVRHSEVIKGK